MWQQSACEWTVFTATQRGMPWGSVRELGARGTMDIANVWYYFHTWRYTTVFPGAVSRSQQPATGHGADIHEFNPNKQPKFFPDCPLRHHSTIHSQVTGLVSSPHHFRARFCTIFSSPHACYIHQSTSFYFNLISVLTLGEEKTHKLWISSAWNFSPATC